MKARPRPLVTVAPVLRWAGGKRRLLEVLDFALPDAVGPGYAGRLVEPFAGGASFFFWLQPSSALLCDANAELMNVYRCVKSNASEVGAQLRTLSVDSGPESYYRTRTRFRPIANPHILDPRHAAMFIYLNKLCFNGLYRVNREGIFNVPYGHRRKTPEAILDEENLMRASRLLKRAWLKYWPYEKTLESLKPNDFVYLDPPYLPAAKSSEFIDYTRHGFGLADHRRLLHSMADPAHRAQNIRFLMSNSYHPALIREATRLGLSYCPVSVHRSISARVATRGQTTELLIANYELPVAEPPCGVGESSDRDGLILSA